MDNHERIYTLYFVLESLIDAIENITKHRQYSIENYNKEQLFEKFLKEAKRQYSDLHYDLVAEIGGAHTKAEDRFGRLSKKIQSVLGDLRERNNVDLVFTLWIALELALSFYFSVGGDDQSWDEQLGEKVKFAQAQYSALSYCNDADLQHLDSIIKSRLGNF